MARTEPLTPPQKRAPRLPGRSPGTPTKPTTNGTEEAEERQFPKLEPADFFKLVKKHPDHAGTYLYVYRLEPEIVRQLAGIKDNFIDRLTYPYPTSEEGIFMKHGGGKYQLTFNDLSLPRGKQRVAYCIPVADWRDRPPNINYVELVNSNTNAAYLQHLIAKGEIIIDPDTGKIVPVTGAKDGPKVIAVQTQPGASSSQQDTIVAKLLDHALSRRDSDTPVLEIVKLVTALVQARPPDESTAALQSRLDTLLADREALSIKLAQLEARASTPPPAPAKPPLEILKDTLETYAALKAQLEPPAPPAAVATAPDATAPWYQGVITGALNALTPVIQQVGYQLTGKLLSAADSPGGGAGAPEPVRRASPGPVRGYAQAIDDDAPPTQVQTSAQPKAPAPIHKEDPIRQLVSTVQYCLDREIPGSSLAIHLELRFQQRGPYKQLCALGKEQLIAQMQQVTDLWPVIAAYGPERLDTFIDEFITAFDEAGGTENEL